MKNNIYSHVLNMSIISMDNDDYYTPAMKHIKEFRTEPPANLMHDPTLIGGCGLTMASLFIILVKQEPPESIRTPADFQDGKGNTMAMLYVIFVRQEPPEYMRHQPKLKNKADHTMWSLWLKFVGFFPPSWMEFCRSYTTLELSPTPPAAHFRENKV